MLSIYKGFIKKLQKFNSPLHHTLTQVELEIFGIGFIYGSGEIETYFNKDLDE